MWRKEGPLALLVGLHVLSYLKAGSIGNHPSSLGSLGLSKSHQPNERHLFYYPHSGHFKGFRKSGTGMGIINHSITITKSHGSKLKTEKSPFCLSPSNSVLLPMCIYVIFIWCPSKDTLGLDKYL